MSIQLRTAAATAAVAVIGIGIAGIAYADSGHSGSSAAGAAHRGAASAAAARRHPLLRRMLHGQFVLKARGGKTVTVDLQQGSVTAVSPTAISVRSSDGVEDQYVVTSRTRVRADGKVLATSDIATGDHVFVVGLDNGKGITTARAIRGVRSGSSAN